MWQWIADYAGEDQVRSGSWAALIHEAVREGSIAESDRVPLLHAFSTASVDTTIASIASMIWLFAHHPDQWRRLREDPSLVPSAFNEVVRLESPIQMFTRVAGEDIEIESVSLESGTRVIVGYQSANRDERQFEDPDSFDIGRNPVGHLAFGHGLHGCVGQGVARLEAHAVLKALLARVEGFEILDEERSRRTITRVLNRVEVRLSGPDVPEYERRS
jgi:cytochrome P450